MKLTASFSSFVSIVNLEPFFFITVKVPVLSSYSTSDTSELTSNLSALLVSILITRSSTRSSAASILFKLVSFIGVSSLG